MQKNILIVEDDTLLSDALSQILTERGYAIRIAHNGWEGLEQIAIEKPQFILLDLMMPEMGGIEMLGEFQKDPTNKNIPVAVLTNANDMDSVTEVVANGGYHYFIKADTPLKAITEHVIQMLEPVRV